MIDQNDVSSYNETKKGALAFNTTKNFYKKNTQQFPNILSNNTREKSTNRKSVNIKLENIFGTNKKSDFLSKNSNLKGNNKLSPQLDNIISNFDFRLETEKKPKLVDKAKLFLRKFTKKKIINKNEFLLFTKARPYRYMTSEGK